MVQPVAMLDISSWNWCRFMAWSYIQFLPHGHVGGLVPGRWVWAAYREVLVIYRKGAGSGWCRPGSCWGPAVPDVGAVRATL